MPKVTMEFSLPEDEQLLKDVIAFGLYKSNLELIYNLARGVLKHGDLDNVENLVATLEQIKEISFIE